MPTAKKEQQAPRKVKDQPVSKEAVVTEPEAVPSTPPARVHKRPSANSWLIAAIICGLILAAIVGFVIGGIVTAGRDATTPRRGEWLQPQTHRTTRISMPMSSSSYWYQASSTTAKVSAVSDSSITVQYTNGAKSTYTINGSTRIVTSDGSTGTVSDIKVGNSVILQSYSDSNGDTASTIILQ